MFTMARHALRDRVGAHINGISRPILRLSVTHLEIAAGLKLYQDRDLLHAVFVNFSGSLDLQPVSVLIVAAFVQPRRRSW